MSIDRVIEPLLNVPIFQGLPEAQLRAIARDAEKVKFKRGEIITHAGETGNAAYIVVSGAAERFGEPYLLAVPEPIEVGSMIGELAMLIEHEYGSTIRASQRTLCLKIPRGAVEALMLEDPSLAAHFETYMTDRLLKIAEELRLLAGPAADAPVTDEVEDDPAPPAIDSSPAAARQIA
jgi:CRP-like cAMP-binding protein